MPVPGKNPLEPYFQPYGLVTDLLTLTGLATPVGAPPGTVQPPPYRIGQLGQTSQLILVAGSTQSKIIPGSAGLTIRNNTDTADNFVVDGSGNVSMAATGDISNQSLSLTPAVLTAVNVSSIVTKVAIPDTTATGVARFTVPNLVCSISGTIAIRTAVTAVGHVYDSTRTAFYTFALSRIAGGATTVSLSAATIPLIATSGTSTLTSALTFANLLGANSATQTIDFLVANVGTPAGISEATLTVNYTYGEATGAGPFISLTAL